jgi:hypothetical protein
MLYQRGLWADPFEKGETGGFECDFDAGMVWTYSTNFSDTTLDKLTRLLPTRRPFVARGDQHGSLLERADFPISRFFAFLR